MGTIDPRRSIRKSWRKKLEKNWRKKTERTMKWTAKWKRLKGFNKLNLGEKKVLLKNLDGMSQNL